MVFSNKQLLQKALEENGTALTIVELSQKTQLQVAKIRQTLTTWEKDIVRIGPQTYDLKWRVYCGKTFRHTPQAIEIEKGILSTETDVYYYLIASFDYRAKITLYDEDDVAYPLTDRKQSKNLKLSYLSGLSKWFKKYNFEVNDDILFTCKDIKTHEFKIRRQKKQERDEFIIAAKNRRLADLVYDIINHTLPKQEGDMFLIRKYVYVYPFNDPVPPDGLIKVLANNKRFLISNIDKMYSWTGHRIKDFLTVGLRKYYLQNDKKDWIPVIIDTDEFGKYGYCSQCSERVIWESDIGWHHTKTDFESAESYIPNEFFTSDNSKTRMN
ncbi:TPA: hypothetical protein DIV55_06165 [Patescibacteria group bacterium]|uniref:Uncharacterized protein n=1 Tax=Candidatus Gottesmanbacteria bacterium GW2011_GWA1_43_11 TaxID=1618436 RepID=A0A0G1CIX4_9BACT|nr:MAG: hypothetical protein UV59_C0005G0006 [Candidatus Gottesmanbacteria bacterium GW2011_GWA1_43_11]HCS79291.1 hypothetical protein [Patescibacteria group bacterium]